ncbi:MAG TPA: Asp-tRNA(Asn)/Glu-tRNA(Gln) amidotransferase subunit GatB [Candidatus Saccharimonadales bacterium]|nr:Asp-tRNA(Asn)/Glu-tRNA(Gln) amidotransferase subunit GatB [Candidatus Saccharimonadales bacterium]
MLDATTLAAYRATIGIECHVQLKTKTKLFAAVGNDAREAPPNTLVSHICFGLPGALPVLNEEALHLATRAAFALGTEPERFSKFDRKHYFYPDLPKGYQISQYDEPIIAQGAVTIEVDGKPVKVGITRAHLEEDAGKNTHPAGADYSLVDLNRAGTPLLEIVSEPDIHTAAEAKAYARELYLRMKYAGVSDADLYYGNMRFDVNVSVSRTGTLGTRTETKNLNSFRAVEKAVEYEIKRQAELLEKGKAVVQETRGWNDAKQKTFAQRSKEEAEDYRYMPEPDIPPIVLEKSFIEEIKAEMPVMPDEWRKRLGALGVEQKTVELMIDIQADRPEYEYLEFIEANLNDKDFAKWITNTFVNIIEPLRADSDTFTKHDWADTLPHIYKLIKDGKLSSSRAKDLINDVFTLNAVPKDIQGMAEQKGYIQVSDEGAIATIVAQVIKDNPKAAGDVKDGEMKAIGFLVGQVMKASKGQANPSLAQRLIKKQLGI